MEFENAIPESIFLLGLLAVLAVLFKSGAQRLGASSVVGFLFLGLLVRIGDEYWAFLSPHVNENLAFLAEIGIFCFLFRVGLESNLTGLLSQLKRAGLVWIGNVLVSGLLGYATCIYLLQLPLIPSLFVAVAFTATSIGIPSLVWKEAGLMESETGEVFLDVAELDDISAVVFMAVLFALAPTLHIHGLNGNLGLIMPTIFGVLLKLGLFATGCLLFSLYLEQPLARFFRRLDSSTDSLITILGMALLIAALAGLLGFSVALGAFFVGVVYSRDPEVVKMDVSFDALFALFTPFFFIHIGLTLDPTVLSSAGGVVGLILLGVAATAKFIGTALPALLISPDPRVATLLGVSMIPRAEISLVVMKQGLSFGDWAVSTTVFSAMILVSAGTCLSVPFVLRVLLSRWGYALHEEESCET